MAGQRKHHEGAQPGRATRRWSWIFAAAAAVLMTAVPQASAQFTHVGRGPSINMNAGPRISINPHIRYSPNINYDDPGRGGPPPRYRAGPPRDFDGPPPRRASKRKPSTAADNTFVPKEVLIEIEGTPSDNEANALARRHRLTRVQSQSFPLLSSTFFRWRIPDGRSVDAVVRELAADRTVKSAQRNSIFRLQQAAAPAEKGAPEQYALEKLQLRQAHALSTGEGVRVAVIDSGIDAVHPELSGAVESAFDALGGGEAAHAHGTGIAGIIAAHGRLTGAAPSARLIAIRAFGAQKSGATSTSFVLLKSLDYAMSHGAQIINMSFAGPQDPALRRGLGVAADKGITLVAAAGNDGPKSPPLYPGADPRVIAVTATDASDRLFAAANRGSYVAIAAPGVDILTALPDGKYGVSSGTSLSAAFVSGLAALMLARNPALTPDDLRLALTKAARDLGPAGRDDQFGAGEANALAAVSAIEAPVATASGGVAPR
jgi:subtilisin family serine protease